MGGGEWDARGRLDEGSPLREGEIIKNRIKVDVEITLGKLKSVCSVDW